jgi:hypothetical protein
LKCQIAAIDLTDKGNEEFEADKREEELKYLRWKLDVMVAFDDKAWAD